MVSKVTPGDTHARFMIQTFVIMGVSDGVESGRGEGVRGPSQAVKFLTPERIVKFQNIIFSFIEPSRVGQLHRNLFLWSTSLL